MSQREIKVSELPEYLQQGILREVDDYSISLLGVQWKGERGRADLLGSGTLVRIDDQPLILTAGHVLKSKSWDLTSPTEMTHLGLVIAGYVHSYKIPLEHLSMFGEYNLEDSCKGPDVGFVLLPETAIGDIAARKSFLNLTGGFTRRSASKMVNNMDCWVIVGSPAEDAREITSTDDDTQEWDLEAMVGFGGIEGNPDKENQDLIDASVIFDEGYQGPSDFRGVSGGGLWRVRLNRLEDGTIQHSRALFAGVPIYQMQRSHDKTLIRCQHRDCAIRLYRQLRTDD